MLLIRVMQPLVSSPSTTPVSPSIHVMASKNMDEAVSWKVHSGCNPLRGVRAIQEGDAMPTACQCPRLAPDARKEGWEPSGAVHCRCSQVFPPSSVCPTQPSDPAYRM